MTPEDSKKKEKNKIKEECFQRNKCQGWLMMDPGVRTTALKASQWGEEWGWLTDQSTQAFGQHLPAGSDTPGFPLSGHERPTDCEEWRRSLPWSSPKEIGQHCSGELGHHQMEADDYHIWWPHAVGSFGGLVSSISPSYLLMYRNSGSST